MRLKSISYREWHGTPQSWELETLSLGPRMLIVGRNSAGKSRSLAIISGLAKFLVGAAIPGLSGDYVATFEYEGGEYVYEVIYLEQKITHERIVINGVEYLSRGSGGTGKIIAEKVGAGTFIDFQMPPMIFAAVARRDAIQHSFIEPLFDWASSLRYYQFGGGLGQANLAVFGTDYPQLDEKDQFAVVPIFRKGEKLFGEPFVDSIKKDLAKIDYDVENVILAPPVTVRFSGPTTMPSPVSLSVKEVGLTGVTDQLGMSSGMYRVVALLVHVNFAQFKGSTSSVLIDDVGEGLDFDRSCRLINLLRAKAVEFNFQLIMATNDKFVMNEVPLNEWTVLHRSGSVVHIRNQENSREIFEEFKFTGLSNFSFFEMNASEMNARSESGDYDA
jgi:hypothetical protein